MSSLTPVEAYLTQLAPGSRKAQRCALNLIAGFLSGGRKNAEGFRWEKMSFRDATRVRSWIGRTYQPATARRMMSAMHQVHRMCWRLRLLSKDKLARLVDTEPVRGRGAPPGRALRPAELQALAAACGRTDIGRRNRAMVGLMHYVGLRTVEVVRVEVGDIAWDAKGLDARLIRVRGKGARDRMVPIGDSAAEDLAAWSRIRGQARGPFFPRMRCRDFDPAAQIETLSSTAISAVLRKLSKEAGLQQHFSPHDLRRTFVTRLLENGEDLEVVRQLCGHESIETTRRYDRRPLMQRARAAVLGLEFTIDETAGEVADD